MLKIKAQLAKVVLVTISIVILGSIGLASDQINNAESLKDLGFNLATPIVADKSATVPPISKGKEILVTFKDQVGSNSFLSLSQKYDLSLEKEINLGKKDINIFKAPLRADMQKLVAELNASDEVEYAQINYQYQKDLLQTLFPVIPENDPDFPKLWGLHNEGQVIKTSTGVVDADTDMPEAWDISTGNHEVIVAIIDDGVDFNHPDLKHNLWDGSNKCYNSRGDYIWEGCPNHGWDFSRNTFGDDPRPDPFNSHGTHIAGTIAATANNGEGLIGINHQVSIMALKTDLSTSSLIEAIYFARNNGAKIINASWGGYGPWLGEDIYLYNAINDFGKKGGLFVAAAGNGATDHDSGKEWDRHYPSSWDLDNIISVAASDNKDQLASFSDYGIKSVDLAAPGVSIYSTVSEEIYFQENFNDSTVPEMPESMNNSEPADYFGTREATAGNNELVGDLKIPYRAETEAYAEQKLALDLTDYEEGALITFDTTCDTEYDYSWWTDYMQFEWFDGEEWQIFFRWDEMVIDSDNDPEGSATRTIGGYIPSEYIGNGSKYRFRWITNDNENTGSEGLGCSIDNFRIFVDKTDNSSHDYAYYDGTSMAAPHVAGTLALMMSKRHYEDGSLYYYEYYKRHLLNSVDKLDQLINKTVSAGRLNTYKTLASVSRPHITNLEIFNIDTAETILNDVWTSASNISFKWLPSFHEGKVIGYNIELYKMSDINYLDNKDLMDFQKEDLSYFERTEKLNNLLGEPEDGSEIACEKWIGENEIEYYLCSFGTGSFYGFIDTEYLEKLDLEDGEYWFWINAKNDSHGYGNSEHSKIKLDTTAPTDPIITRFEPYNNDPTALILEVTPSSDAGIGQIAYLTCINKEEDNNTCTTIEEAGFKLTKIRPNSTTDTTQMIYIVEGLDPNSKYFSHVRATDGLGHESAWAKAQTTTLPIVK